MPPVKVQYSTFGRDYCVTDHFSTGTEEKLTHSAAETDGARSQAMGDRSCSSKRYYLK